MARILIVDDSGMMRRNLSIILQEAGHEIVGEATSGVQAFSEYEQKRPDVVTMDIDMPEMNGIDSIKKIIDKFPEASVIMVSSIDNKRRVIEAIQSGARNYVLKPFSRDKVLTAVDDILRTKGLLIPSHTKQRP